VCRPIAHVLPGWLEETYGLRPSGDVEGNGSNAGTG
jgi:hypothetical protein